MKIKILGNGCTWTAEANTHFIINDRILVDFPDGGFKQLLKARLDLSSINTLIITHFHSDHFFDAGIFIMQKLSNKDLTTKYKILSPRGGRKKIMELLKLSCKSYYLDNKDNIDQFFDFYEFSNNKEITIDDFTITPLKMNHYDIESYGVILSSLKEQKTIGYSSDTTLCNNLKLLVEKSDLVVLNTPEIEDTLKHLGFNTFLRLAKKYPTKKFIPLHLSPKTLGIIKKHGFLFPLFEDINL